MTTSEPTTGENNDWISTEIIVRMLRKIQNSAQVVLDSGFGTRDGECNMVYRDRRDNMKLAADRLESQAKENEISRHLIEMQSNVITELTARAEQAEQERDLAELKNQAANVFIERIHLDFKGYMPSEYYEKRGVYVKRRRELGERGLPQEGEGK